MNDSIIWETSPEDYALIKQIASRFEKLKKGFGDPQPYLFVIVCMDITACHMNGNPLRLQDLLDADDFEFAHDVVEINHNIDPNTGSLLNGFIPKHSVSVAEPDPNQTSLFQEN